VGIDVKIAMRAKPGYAPPDPKWIDGNVSDCTYLDGYTHELSSMTRYYGRGYERGPWPDIAAYLIQLMADPNVEAVGYGGDSDDYREPVTLEWLTQMNLHYIDNQERPYRERGPTVKRSATVHITSKAT
jgi:hypothetical protein